MNSVPGMEVVDWDIMRKAKSYFIKCNRILYKCLHPGTSKYKMRGILSAAWNTLPSSEKQIYVLQVLQRGHQRSIIIKNPQLQKLMTGICQISPSAEKKRKHRKQTVSPYTNPNTGGRAFIGAANAWKEEVHLLKHMQEAQPEDEFHFSADYKNDDYDGWARNPDPEDLFPELHI